MSPEENRHAGYRHQPAGVRNQFAARPFSLRGRKILSLAEIGEADYRRVRHIGADHSGTDQRLGALCPAGAPALIGAAHYARGVQFAD